MIRYVLIAVLLFGTSVQAQEYNWEKLEGCTLVKNTWQDGDSFTVRVSPRKFRIFRLYFVDTPEDGKDTRYPERVAEQAKYFGVSLERAVQIGNEAEAFTARTLSAQPFTVYTLWQGAPGASKKPRFYAFVVTEKGPLCSLLVKNGLARIYGKRIQFPDGTVSRTYLEKLSKMESRAQTLKVGGWGIASSAEVKAEVVVK